jgi:N-acetylmuramic acid 6-phosphate etherase
LTLGIANNPGTPLLQEAEHAIFLETGPEPIAGSTRMNAGTAQRIALSLLSSLVMIRLGKVYAGLMVDVQASNAKIAERRENMLIHLTGSSGEDVREALKRARGSVKLALLLLKGCDLKEAERVLDRAGGQLRAALALMAQDPPSARRRMSGEPPHARHAG